MWIHELKKPTHNTVSVLNCKPEDLGFALMWLFTHKYEEEKIYLLT